MSTKGIMYLGAGIGGTIGSFVPALWGDNLLGGWSILLGGVGGVLGIWIAYKLVH